MDVEPVVRAVGSSFEYELAYAPPTDVVATLIDDVERGGAAFPRGDGTIASAADGLWYSRERKLLDERGMADVRLLLGILFLDGTTGGRVGTKAYTPFYVGVANRAKGLARGAWRYGGILPEFDEDTLESKRIYQQVVHELWTAYAVATEVPLRSAGGTVWQLRFRLMLDMKENDR
eukprot:gene5996-6349_t